MFEEPEWAEAAPAATGLRPVISRPRAEAPSQIKGSRRRQLLATLHALEAASLPRQPASLPDSESEEEEEEVRRKKKKQAKRASLTNASVQVVEKRKNKCQKRSPPSSNSEEGETERKKKFCKQGLLGNDLTEGQKKCQKAAPGNTTQPLTNGVQTDPQIQKSSVADEPLKPSPGSSSAKPPQTLTRKQWRNRQKNKRRHKNKFRPAQAPDQVATEAPAEAEVPSAPKPEGQEARAEALRARMAQRLDGARFRYLNEQLYSKPSSAAQRLFQEDPEAFLLYHRGFQSQVKKWPLHPVDRIARDLRHRPASLVVADFGCGDCRLASSIRNTVHCFDLASLDPRVTVCDMAQVPLQDESVDVAVFCLSLMGTNIRDFLEEANRVLKPGGLLKVAEVSSRFEDVRGFLGAVSKLGFKVISKDLTNSHFFLFDFHKTGPPRVGPKAQLSGLKLQPCLYKRR